MRPTLLLLFSITVAAALLAAFAATAAILYYRTMPRDDWTVNELLKARDEPMRPFYPLLRPIAVFAWTVATLLAIFSAVVAFGDSRRVRWLFPTVAIFFVLASGVLMFWAFYQ
jgi:hypothetical protein